MADAAHERIEGGAIPAGHWLTEAGDRDGARIIYSREQIQQRVREMADDITRFYPAGEDLLVLGLLKGSFIFLADLVRAINRPLHVDFIVASSYGTGTTTSGNVRLLYDPMAPIADRHVLLVEDIVDSGNTVNRLAEALEKREPKSLELCALLHKHLATDLQLEPRWTGFDAPPEFLVGYGLDHAEDFRHLPFVAGL
jgi:hypoxanthine phosphoribosyltransferase